MPDNRFEVQQKQRRRLFKSLVLNGLGICLAIFLLVPPGLIFRWTQADLSFLLLPLIGYFLLRLGSDCCLIYITSRAGYSAVFLLRGAAAAFLIFWIFKNAILFTRLSAFAGSLKIFSGLSEIAVFAVLFIFGSTLARICGLYKSHTAEKYVGPLGISLGQFIMGYSLWQSGISFSVYWRPFADIGLVLMAGLTAVSLSTLGLLGEKSRNALTADLCAWLRSSPVGKFFLGAALAAYIIFLRPLIFEHLPYAFLFEWVLLCMVAWWVYSKIVDLLGNRYTAVTLDTDWHKHIQQVDDLIDEDFEKIGLLQRDFVELGNRRGLLNYLRQVLRNNKLTDDQNNNVLRNLIEYSDNKIPWYNFWIWRKRKMNQNIENRKTALQCTINNLSELAHPVYKKKRRTI